MCPYEQGGEELEEARSRLLAHIGKDVDDPRVLQAMERIPREVFVPEANALLAYEDIPLPIGEGQTISQPFIVAMMASALELRRTDKVLEIGTGSGYQAAVLAELARCVVTVERIKALADTARQRLDSMGYKNVEVVLTGDRLGWREHAPYNAIIVAAGAPRLPQELIDQLEVGGRLVVPVGTMEAQDLMKINKTEDGFSVHALGPCRFVPLIGEGAWPETDSNARGSQV